MTFKELRAVERAYFIDSLTYPTLEVHPADFLDLVENLFNDRVMVNTVPALAPGGPEGIRASGTTLYPSKSVLRGEYRRVLPSTQLSAVA